ncbi:MAG: GNAT family N-acetyltransferase [Xanthobacteraceae bacterium]|nr:GNAT family N-acetyltransferase [Xanthobacteraceae bacterium]MBV9631822.1 GNAT family N-acetyltransferase [Xanthobacteraceae bacterium]
MTPQATPNLVRDFGTFAGAPRRATIDDAGQLGAVHLAAWRETYAGIVPDAMLAGLSVEARAAMWAKILGNPSSFAETAVYVIEEDASMVGFGACGRQRDSHLKELGFDAEISAIYVLRSRQCRGIGRALMAEMATDLRTRVNEAAALWVLRENAAARAFYQRLAGEVVAEKEDRREHVNLLEIAYGWRKLPVLRRPLL